MKETGKLIRWEILPGSVCKTETFELAVATVVFGVDGSAMKVLLAPNGISDFETKWALPGGTVGIDESLEEAATRTIERDLEIRVDSLRQFHTFGNVGRHPENRVVTTAFFALMRIASAKSSSSKWIWFPVDHLPSLDADHESIIRMAHRRLQHAVRYEPIGDGLLPERFTMRQIQTLYEAILQHPVERLQFRRQIWNSDLIIPLQETRASERLYKFNWNRYRRLQHHGLRLEF